MGRSFYVYKSKNGKYMAEFLDPKTGVRMCFRTVAARSYSEAVEIASGWVHSGIPKRKRGRTPVYKPVIQPTGIIPDISSEP